MKIFFSTWPERSQRRTLDKHGVKHRLISYAHIRSATRKSKDVRQVLKELGITERTSSAGSAEGRGPATSPPEKTSAKKKTVVPVDGFKGKGKRTKKKTPK